MPSTSVTPASRSFCRACSFSCPGHTADRFDRRQIILVCYGLQVLCTTALLLLCSRRPARRLSHLPGAVFHRYRANLLRTRQFSIDPATGSQKRRFVNAVTWGATIFQFATIVGPALGGVLFTLPLTRFVPDTLLQGPGIVYVFTLGTLGWSLVLVGSMGTHIGRVEHRDISLKVVLTGFQYMSRSPLLLGAASLDLFAVLLGGAVALTPIFANDILHTGPRGLGMLRAAPAAGAVTMSLLMARFPFRRRAGVRLFLCVAIFGAATVVFGSSRSLALSLTALFVAGAADSISVIIRGSLLQLATPPEMRGRVSAVNSLFIGASNELGEFESGLTAQWWGAVEPRSSAASVHLLWLDCGL